MDRELADLVWKRAAGCCEYCCMPHEFDSLPFEIDHVIAESHGGATVASNLALSCFPCNRFKGPNLSGLDPQTSQIVRLFNPRRHRWSAHFRWRNGVLIGTTAIGRTTIRVLHMNEFVRVRLRTELLSEGVLKLD